MTARITREPLAALHAAAHGAMEGDAGTAFLRLRAAMRNGDPSLFARVAEELALRFPFDARFVARALATLHAYAVDGARAMHTKMRARNRLLSQSARRDALTGIANRATLEESLTSEIRRAQRFHRWLSILFIDIDRFKDINDRFGHAVGDDVLRQVVSRIGSALRPGDVFGRYGGEELAVGLANTGRRGALGTAERLRRTVERARFASRSMDVRVTISIGIATLSPGEDTTLAELLHDADRTMLHAKATGRNKVCAWWGLE